MYYTSKPVLRIYRWKNSKTQSKINNKNLAFWYFAHISESLSAMWKDQSRLRNFITVPRKSYKWPGVQSLGPYSNRVNFSVWRRGEVVTSRCLGCQGFWISTNHGPAVMTENMTFMTFLCTITLRNKTVAHTCTFLPLFDNANGCLWQERLLWSRKFATMVTWHHTSPPWWWLKGLKPRHLGFTQLQDPLWGKC